MLLSPKRSLPIWLAVLGALFSTATLAGDRYYGSADGLELRVENDPEAPGVYLQVWHFDGVGRGVQLLLPVRLRQQSVAQTFGGVALNRGDEPEVSIAVAVDGQSLSWLQPKQLRLENGGAILMAGEHLLLDEAARKSVAQRHFAAADRQLNAAYGELRDRMDAERFAELRANQRLWLKYRDWFIADGDDADINGPGSVPFLRQQVERTLDRVGFLRAVGKPRTDTVDPSGIYSDGIDRELRLRARSATPGQVFFSLGSANPALHDSDDAMPWVVSGRASSNDDAGPWTADGDGVNSNPLITTESELLIESANEHGSLLISAASSPVFTGRLYRVADLQPANEPMRGILGQLPVAVFDHTTEGLSAEDRTTLLMTGRAEPFELRDGDTDSIRVEYAEGSVGLRRFPRRDGGAWIAVETTNVRARSFELWALAADQAGASRLSPSDVLPGLDATDFFQASDAADSAEGRLDYALGQLASTIDVHWLVDGEGPEANFLIEINWDGFGFGGVERRSR